VREKGYCQKFVRQILESVYQKKYAPYMKASAKVTAHAFLNAGLGVRYNGQALEPGDILFKTVGSGGFGHVGVWTGSKVAENSSYHARRDSDARGFRSLSEYGEFQVLVRLPDPRPATVTGNNAPPPQQQALDKETRFYLQALYPDTHLPGAFIKGDTLYAPVKETVKAFGFVVVKYNDRRKDMGRVDVRAVPAAQVSAEDKT
jgi:hypothetical protein